VLACHAVQYSNDLPISSSDPSPPQIASCPPGTQVVTLDMIQAYRISLIILTHKKYLVVCWCDSIYVQHNSIKNLSSAGGIQGTPADACIDILHANKIHPIFKWVDDFVIFHSPSLLCLPDAVFYVTDPLGIPWHPVSKKGQDFGMTFKYLGLIWYLTAQMVSLPIDKCNHSLLKLTTFTSRQCMSQNDCTSLLSTLQHVCFIYQDTCSSLPALSQFLAKFPNNYILLHHGPHTVLDDLEIWWQCLLCQTMTHSLMPRSHFDPNLHVDVSSSYGVRFAIETDKQAGN